MAPGMSACRRGSGTAGHPGRTSRTSSPYRVLAARAGHDRPLIGRPGLIGSGSSGLPSRFGLPGRALTRLAASRALIEVHDGPSPTLASAYRDGPSRPAHRWLL